MPDMPEAIEDGLWIRQRAGHLDDGRPMGNIYGFLCALAGNRDPLLSDADLDEAWL
jgi:hypothetical protein